MIFLFSRNFRYAGVPYEYSVFVDSEWDEERIIFKKECLTLENLSSCCLLPFWETDGRFFTSIHPRWMELGIILESFCSPQDPLKIGGFFMLFPNGLVGVFSLFRSRSPL